MVLGDIRDVPGDLTEGPGVPSRMAPLAGRGRLGGAATMSRETWRRAGDSSGKMAETGATLPGRKTRLRPFGYAPLAPSAGSPVWRAGRVSSIKRRNRHV